MQMSALKEPQKHQGPCKCQEYRCARELSATLLKIILTIGNSGQ